MDFVVSIMDEAESVAAIDVWRAANIARGMPPSERRVARVVAKLRHADACRVVGRSGSRVRAMALAEAGRAGDGSGEMTAGWGHVSMVFVHPEVWGQGLGIALMAGLHDAAHERGWVCTSLWTRRSNERALRLYVRCGYRLTGRSAQLGAHDLMVELERRPPMGDGDPHT